MNKPTEIKVNYRAQYLIFQIVGWSVLVSVIALFNLQKSGLALSLFLFGVFVSNIAISHVYRWVVSYFGWLQNRLFALLLKIVGASIVLGLLFSLVVNGFSYLVIDSDKALVSVSDWLFGSLVYLLWSLLYFGYLLFYKARITEYKNMQMEALNAQIELNNLRSQLNPHFMFNAMNSIRALIDENPEQSKKAVTQLSNVLRNSLIHSKKDLVTLQEEMTIVTDYLSLEKIRYEERLEVTLLLDKNTLGLLVPPLMIQTLVENAIKHGISRLKSGGELKIISKKENETHWIEIVNPGAIEGNKKKGTKIGILNTQKRLELHFGKKAKFEMKEEEDKVRTIVNIPLIPVR